MTFDTILTAAKQAWFDSDLLASSATLNGGAVTVCILERGTEDDDNSVFDYLDVALQPADYATVTYRTDTLVYDGVTWRYPRVMKIDEASLTVRWIADQKPRITR